MQQLVNFNPLSETQIYQISSTEMEIQYRLVTSFSTNTIGNLTNQGVYKSSLTNFQDTFNKVPVDFLH